MKALHLFTFIILTCACKKFVTVPLPGIESDISDIFTNDVTARSAMLGIYGEMIGKNGFASGNTRSAAYLCGLSADELESYSSMPMIREFYDNGITTGNKAIETALWGAPYKCIHAANIILEELPGAASVSDSVKNQLLGEALFTRAFCYFYLVNLFGEVPNVRSTDYHINATLPRASRDTIYKNIILDLRDAQKKLDVDYLNNDTSYNERIRPNKWAATALLARALLYTGDWAGAEAQASLVIAATDKYSLEDSLNQVFVIKSREAIWQLKSNTPGINTWEGKNLILISTPGNGESSSACLSKHLRETFEQGDLRRSLWVDSITTADKKTYYYPYKYKVKSGDELSEYSMVLRLAEQYLIRAEARVRLGNNVGATGDLNMIRRRAGLPAYSGASDKSPLIAAILRERQLELFSEWGHRWLDLKRTGQAGKTLSETKTTGWQDFDTLYPIPKNECLLNPFLTQNSGY